MKFKVIGTWGAQKYTTEIGEFATLEEAMDCAHNWREAPKSYGLHMDLIEVIAVSQSTVYSAHTAPRDCGEDGGETQGKKPDYASDTVLQMQRVGVPPSTGRFESILTQPNEQVDALQKTVWKLEDRHVGLRNDVMLDIDELRDEMSKEIVAVRRDVTMDVMNSDSDIRALKNEVEVLRREVEALWVCTQ